MSDIRKQPIAVFDSGVGGISVLKELVKILPNENYIYFGDSKNAPYGMKTIEEVRLLTTQCAEELFRRGAKALVVACNTATSAAVRTLREKYPDIPIVGIEPAVKPAVSLKPLSQSGDKKADCPSAHPRVLVLATPMTIREEKFKNLMNRYTDQGEIIPLPCPGLMDFVERGDLHSLEFRKYLEELLYEYKQDKVDAAVLGCTHYPFAKDLIQEILGDDVVILDGGEGTAREMKRRLDVAGLLNPSNTKGEILFENSLKDDQKLELCKRLFDL
jgi:glutamate racemase